MTGEAKTKIIVHTDGSARRRVNGDGFPGGFAFVVESGDSRMERYGWANTASSNQMELSAILAALTVIPCKGFDILLKSDSEYCVKGLTIWYHKWKRSGWLTAVGEPVKNVDLIQATIDAIEKHTDSGGLVTVMHVKGHSGVLENERADALASRARKMQICNIKTPMKLPGLDFHQHQPRARKCPTS